MNDLLGHCILFHPEADGRGTIEPLPWESKPVSRKRKKKMTDSHIIDKDEFTITFPNLMDADTGKPVVHRLTHDYVLERGFDAIDETLKEAGRAGGEAARRMQRMARIQEQGDDRGKRKYPSDQEIERDPYDWRDKLRLSHNIGERFELIAKVARGEKTELTDDQRKFLDDFKRRIGEALKTVGEGGK